MENTELQTAETLNADTKRLHSEITEMMVRVNIQSVENTKMLDLSYKSVLLSIGQTVTLEPKDYSGNLKAIAEKLASDSGQLAANLHKNKETRNCQDVMLEIMQLAMVNKDNIYIHSEFTPSANNFTVHVVEVGSSYEPGEVKWLYDRTVYFAFGDNPLQAMLEIEDKLLELIADAKDKAEVAA